MGKPQQARGAAGSPKHKAAVTGAPKPPKGATRASPAARAAAAEAAAAALPPAVAIAAEADRLLLAEAAAAAAKAGGKKQSQSQPSSPKAGATPSKAGANGGSTALSVVRGQQGPSSTQSESILVTGLQTDLGAVYQRTVAAFAPPQFKSMPPPIVLRSPDNAVLMFRVNGRKNAKALYQRLEKCVVYGRKWRATYAPATTVTPSTSPTAVDVVMSDPPLSVDQVEAVLGTMPGLLAVTTGDAPNECLATFADEGTALHARAVLSGRRQEGCHVFLYVRRTADGDDDEDGSSSAAPVDSDDDTR